MDCNEITISEDIIKIGYMPDIPAKAPCSIYGNIRIISVYLHAHMLSSISYSDAYCTESDNTKLLAHNLSSGEVLLLLLCCLGNILIILISLYPVNTACNITASKEHTGKYKFLNTIGIGTGCIEYNYTLLSHLIEWDIVNTGTGSGYTEKLLRDLHIMHCRRPYEYALSLIIIIGLDISVIESVKTNLCYWIQTMILIHYAFSFSNFFINSTSASTPSIGIAL